ncbi:hypothetical protein SERLADRAFT_452969 [Serpula lacrymans var. lacrymans S7.9]|uniref:acylaminoacyl-peptidase n=1 Tax=Serpula lacrymans var. lacrymans (strain S7.9) TaxID=578457 RepID=F8P9E8_SERL9|nr:uncharacterized protein SERLADRAFT_452969 [Serpula lacrymans var. lacrymans S7.9]EGO20277.1 hypothetical protein SERLADRAFT_452969 [Serpula lacrymans var. lacrymans S7.9]
MSDSSPHSFYTELSELPVPTSPQFVSSDLIRVSFSVRDHQRNLKRSIQKTYFITPTSLSSSLSQDSSDIQASLISPSNARTAVLRELSEQSGKKRFVEIWAGSRLEASLLVTSTHGSFATDEASTHTPSSDPYAKFRFTPSFGETLCTKKRPTIFLFRWRSPSSITTPIPFKSTQSSPPTPTLSALTFVLPAQDASPVPILLAQAIFASESRVFATGYEHTQDGRLLGIKGCFNRPTGIWALDIPPQGLDLSQGQAKPEGESKGGDKTELTCTLHRLTPPTRSPRSPRVLFDPTSASPTRLFWLSNPTGGAHASCVSLHSLALLPSAEGAAPDPTSSQTLVDTQWDPKPDEFPGFYTEYNLPASPFLRLGPSASASSYIVAQSLWRSRTVVLLINVDTGVVRNVTPGAGAGEENEDGKEGLYSWTVLTTNHRDLVLCTRSTPTTPPEIMLGRFDASGGVEWRVIDKPVLSDELQTALTSLSTSILPIPSRYPVETIVIKSKSALAGAAGEGLKPYCITIPHGGPHATSTTAFSAGTTALALEGYTLSLPNYTGSLGFGQTHVDALLGRCGALDVEDCVASALHLVRLGLAQEGRQGVQGGSHGGFLAAHLIGQHPTLFTAAVLRNPVISSGQLSISDIPDWYYEEFGLPFAPSSLIDPPAYDLLFRASPIAHVHGVRAPVLIALGEDDLRVAPTQGLTYYHALKGRGKVVEMLCFPGETHAIDGVEAAKVSWEAGRDWFKTFSK